MYDQTTLYYALFSIGLLMVLKYHITLSLEYSKIGRVDVVY